MKILPTPTGQYPMCARVHTPTGGIIFYTPEEAAEWLDTPHRHMAETYIKWARKTMTNQERAAEVIWEEQRSGIVKPRDLVDALADAGLLMPDLPEPDDASIFVPNGAGWQTPQDSTVWTAIGGRVMIQRVEPGNFTPGEARSLALALLAAAKLAEEQE